ncbi:MAG TPA: hypothetical protein PKE55_12185 [Kiritimatiellia bacterium]|nr:hypothetical protein [Kiritimatiellia bacterium]
MTLPEGVILASVLVILASLAGGAVGQVKLARQIDQAWLELRDLHAATMRYYREYGLWPVEPGAVGDVHLGPRRSNAEAMNRLRAIEGPGNRDHAGNPRRIDFFSTVLEGRDLTFAFTETGEGLDPWGQPYRMAFDTDFNGVLELSDTYSERFPAKGLVVWSTGPDREPGTRRDLRSWK